VKIGFVSRYGDAADIAFRMAIDGHKVALYIDEPKYRENFDGIIPKAKDWRDFAKYDLVVFDDNKCPQVWEALHRAVPCFGGSKFGARLEDDREFAHGVMDRVGIPRLESLSFKTLREVIPHLKEHKVPHVIKPTGKKSAPPEKEVGSHHVVIGDQDDNSDAIEQLESMIEQDLAVESVEVEERKRGVEVGLSVWFNGHDVVGPVNINFEHKRSHDREIGYLTGEMGTLMRYVEDPDLPIYRDTLAKMIPVLRAADYRGQIDLNMIIDDEAAWPLEFTPRLGKPAVFIEDELHVTPWADLFAACANGKSAGLQVRFDWAVGVVLTGFGFPFEEQAVRASRGLVVRGLDEHSLAHVHPMQLRLDRRGRFRVGFGEAYLLVATGRGQSVTSAKDAAYGALRGVRVPNSFHRWDISDKIDAWNLERLGILPVEEGTLR
jgi:phosphoribosylamine--glycine ligase